MIENLKTATRLCQRLIENSRREIYVGMRFFGLALGELNFVNNIQANVDVTTVAVNGKSFIYNTEYVLKYFDKGGNVSRLIVHSLLHCLLRHYARSKQRLNGYAWDVACDIAVANIIDGFGCPFLNDGNESERNKLYDKLSAKVKVLSAEKLYGLLSNLQGDVLAKIGKMFVMDEHSLWKRPTSPTSENIEFFGLGNNDDEENWQENAQRTVIEIVGFDSGSDYDTERLVKALKISCAKKYDFKAFMSRFLRQKEVTVQSQDEFDYIYYCYGLEKYGNVPLIENVEYRDENTVEEIVIVIDTSASTEGELVKKFLENAYACIMQTVTSEKFSLRFLQCDDCVRDVVTVTTKQQFEKFMENFVLHGGGGTNFEKAFDYVNEKVEEHVFGKVKALLYFTDGQGKFPVKQPNYETAFVFIDDEGNDYQVPPWANKLIIGKEN